jgi:very-short-patch-repair endonuclease
MKKRMQPSMFYGASPIIFKRAIELRNAMTDSEIKLWGLLNKNKILGLRFKAQHPIDRFIADFYCHSLKLVIEIDGGIHNLPKNQEYDIGRTFELEKFEIMVIRFINDQIINNFDNVIEEILKICVERKIALNITNI